MAPSTSSTAATLSPTPPGATSRTLPATLGRPPSLRDRISLVYRRRLLEAFRARVQPGPGVRVLDLGGGTGAATEVFARGASEIVVVEPEPVRVARGRESRPTLSFIEGTAENLPFPDRRFDRVVSSLSFHHFQDGARVLGEAYRVLRPGGSLFVLDVEAESGRGRWFRFLHSFSRHGELSFAAPSVVDGWLVRAGFVEARRERLGPYYLLTARK